MSDPKKILSGEDVSAAGLIGWSYADGKLRAIFPTGDFAMGLAFVALVGASAEEAEHHPDIVLTYPEVAVALSSHDVGGITSRDVDLARQINRHAATLEVPATIV